MSEVISLQESNDVSVETSFLNSLLEILPAGVIVINSVGVISRCNPTAKMLLSELDEGLRWFDIVAKNFQGSLAAGHEVKLKDGKYLTIKSCSLPATIGQLVLLIDVTEIRQLHDQISHHQRLSALGEMVASLAHQIRTPLSASLLYGKHLTDQNLTKEKQQRFACKLTQCLMQIERQIKNMLVFSKDGSQVVQAVSLSSLLEQVEINTRALLEKVALNFSIENTLGEQTVLCNPETLVGALMNLVENAIQASPPNTVIRFKIKASQQRAVEFTIEDQGEGMAVTTQQQALTPFYTTRPQGTGLGLAVVNAVAQAHGGTIVIQSEPDKGCVVCFIVPIIKGVSHE